MIARFARCARRVAVLGAIVLCAALHQSAQATIGIPVMTGLVGTPRHAIPGVPFTATLRIATTDTIRVQDFSLSGEGWQVVALGAPSSDSLRGPDSLDVAFTVLTATPERPLRFTYNVVRGNVTRLQSFEFELSYAARLRLESAEPARQLGPDPVVAGPAGPSGPYPSPGPSLPSAPGPSAVGETGVRGTHSRQIRVHGQVAYYYLDGTPRPADGATVQVYDDDDFGSDFLGAGMTGSDGTFDFEVPWDPCGLCENDPDLQLRIYTSNDRIAVGRFAWIGQFFSDQPGLDLNVYDFHTETRENFTGTDWSVGAIGPTTEETTRALHVLSSMTRAWRWHSLNYQELPPVKVCTPSPMGSTYHWALTDPNTIFITREDAWRDDTHAHELGHHWQDTFAWQMLVPDYWNGVCDGAALNPEAGHCAFCEEDPEAAFTEGVSEFLESQFIRHVESEYGYRIFSYYGTDGVANYDPYEFEHTLPCEDADGNSCDCSDRASTEGFIASMLVDMVDGVDATEGGWGDHLHQGPAAILQTLDLDEPQNFEEFLDGHRARFGSTPALWMICDLAGYNPDHTPPGTVFVAADGNSTDHLVGVSSDDATISVRWDRPADDFSGVNAYCLKIGQSPADAPEYTPNVNDAHVNRPSFESGVLGAPDTYYVNIRTRDRAGNWSTSYSVDGPYILRAPRPADLAARLPAGWTYPLVLRNAPTATAGSAVWAPQLSTSGNYWSFAYENVGDSATASPFRAGLSIDGRLAADVLETPVPSGGTRTVLNRGPVTVGGGRHVASLLLDSGEVLSEFLELNNNWGRSFSWNPDLLVPGVEQTHDRPSWMEAGWPDITEGPYVYNSDGYRLQAARGWNAVSVHASSDSADLDCRLHEPPANSADPAGFDNPIAWSSRAEGRVDAVLVHRANTDPDSLFDVGVVAVTPDSLTYKIQHHTSTGVTLGDTVTVSFAAGEVLAMRHVQLPALSLAGLRVTATRIAGDGVCYVGLALPGSSPTALSDLDLVAAAPNGSGLVDTDGLGAGIYAIVLVRDPVHGTTPADVRLVVEEGTVDLADARPAGWFASLVPGMTPGSPTVAPLPDTLAGGPASTFVNVAVQNTGSTDALQLAADVLVDGSVVLSGPLGSLPVGATGAFNLAQPIQVPGGRHLLTAEVRDLASADESPENNAFGGQFVWGPQEMAGGTTLVRSGPPGITDGWSERVHSTTMRYNCDGLRFLGMPGCFHVMAVMPDSGSDVDLRLHLPERGAQDAFGDPLALSAWGPGELDYVLVNGRLDSRSFDAGVVRDGASLANYTAEHAVATALPGGSGLFGPFTVPGGNLIRVHELPLPPGQWTIELFPLSGQIGWTMGMHALDAPYASRSGVVWEPATWEPVPGETQSFSASITDSGTYALVVGKHAAEEVALAGSYRLRVRPATTGADGPDLPLATDHRLRVVGANPAFAVVPVAFTLERDAPVRCVVHDVAGKRVRALDRGWQPAGRQAWTWDGRDANGALVRSGIYWISVEAGARRESVRVVLLR